MEGGVGAVSVGGSVKRIWMYMLPSVHAREMVVHASLPLCQSIYSVFVHQYLYDEYIRVRSILTWPQLKPLRVFALAAVIVPVLLLPRPEGEV